MADQSMRDYGLAAPHGPNMTGQHVATAEANFANMNPNEAGVFRQLLLPDDSYDADGTYWADMKLARRFQFVSKGQITAAAVFSCISRCGLASARSISRLIGACVLIQRPYWLPSIERCYHAQFVCPDFFSSRPSTPQPAPGLCGGRLRVRNTIFARANVVRWIPGAAARTAHSTVVHERV